MQPDLFCFLLSQTASRFYCTLTVVKFCRPNGLT
ncbi:hypothetical protein P3T43_006370 [Paraburkholderia sp. GAS41]